MPMSATRITTPGDETETTARPIARAVAHPPIGRRQMWLFVVHACPYCGGGHHHRGEREQAGLRKAGCGTGTYDVITRRYIGLAPRAVAS